MWRFATFTGMRSLLLGLVCLVACGPEAQPEATTAPAATAEEAAEATPAEPERVSREAEEDTVTPSTPPAPSTPRRLIATRGAARVELEEGAGILVDVNAPPPPPGSTPARHASLHGHCGGDPTGCSEAGGIVRRATTLDEVRTGLEARGFTVSIEP